MFARQPRSAAALLLVCVFAAPGQTTARRAAPSSLEISNQQEMRNYRLSMDKLDKFAAASQSLIRLEKANPGMAEVMGDAGVKTFADAAKRMSSKYPSAAAAIQKTGLTTQEYFTLSMTLMTTTIVAGRKRQGRPLKQLPPSVSPENLAFLEQHYPKVESIMQTLSKAANKAH